MARDDHRLLKRRTRPHFGEQMIAGAEHEIGVAGRREQARSLFSQMLPVCVERHDAIEASLEQDRERRAQGCALSPVHREDMDLGARLARAPCRAVARAVVDDEDILNERPHAGDDESDRMGGVVGGNGGGDTH